MYPGDHAIARAEQPAVIMSQTGESLTYGELEARTNRLSHLPRARGLRRLDHYAIFMENNARYIECCGAGERTGLYYTCVNSHLTADELVYILDNSESKLLITSVPGGLTIWLLDDSGHYESCVFSICAIVFIIFDWHRHKSKEGGMYERHEDE